jgi:hypothetical protein
MSSRILAFLALALTPVLAFAQDDPASRAEMLHRANAERFQGAESRHYILTPLHALRADEREELLAEGLEVQQPMTNGRYLVRIRKGATVNETDPRIASLELLTAGKKIQRSAYREAAGAQPFVTVRIIFHTDVAFADARQAVEDAGGAPQDPLMLGFTDGLPRRMEVRIPPSAIMALANDERVLAIYGRTARMANDNAVSAALSHVTPLFSAPYGLSGNGVTISYFELAAADTAHPEFGGRLVANTTGGAKSDAEHATHTAGTMIASGVNPAAKGMAPQATLQGFSAFSLTDPATYLTFKSKVAPTYGSVADNNSWGYVFGWSQNASGDWVWNEGDEFIAGYDDTCAAIDHIARATGLLQVHSAGNEADNTGPQSGFFVHFHLDAKGNEDDTNIYCYSKDGTGNDCPLAQCSKGTAFCETMHHPTHNPYGSLGMTASAKNVIAVGAVDTQPFIAFFSSRGPTRDGRVKPDLVAKGVNTFSTMPSTSCTNPPCYANKNGTSMSAPVVTGIAALITEQWRKTFGGANPLPVQIKTVLIAGADDLGTPGPDFTYGFGLANAQASIDLVRTDNATGSRMALSQLAQGQSAEFPITLSSTQNLRVVLGWADQEVLNLTDADVAAVALVNDLDLKIIGPSGNTVLPYVLDPAHPDSVATRGVNKVDNTEEVEIASAPAGSYRAIVTASRIGGTDPSQQFALVTNGALGPQKIPCTDPYEPNDTPDTAFGSLPRNAKITARTCTATDLDYYFVRVNGSGPLSVQVTASDTPIRVTLSGNGITPVVANIAPGATQTVSTNVGSGTNQPINPAVTYLIKVEPTGTIGSDASYTLTASYTALEAHIRSIRH